MGKTRPILTLRQRLVQCERLIQEMKETLDSIRRRDDKEERAMVAAANSAAIEIVVERYLKSKSPTADCP